MNVVWGFFFEVGLRETLTLISLTIMDVVEEVFANTLRLNVLDFSHVLFVCSPKTLSSLAAQRLMPALRLRPLTSRLQARLRQRCHDGLTALPDGRG